MSTPASIISAQITPAYGVDGDTLTAVVQVAGVPLPTVYYQWKWRDAGGNQPFSPIPGATASTWTISGYTDKVIACDITAVGSTGPVYGTTTFALVGYEETWNSTSAPTNVVASYIATAMPGLPAGSVFLSWDPPTKKNIYNTVDAYLVRVISKTAMRDTGWISAGTYEGHSFIDLAPGHTYDFYVMTESLSPYLAYSPAGYAQVAVPLADPGSGTGDYDGDGTSGRTGGIASVAAFSTKNFFYPENELDAGYHTYSTKFKIDDTACPGTIAVGLCFNMPSNTDATNAYFVEFVKYKDIINDIRYGLIVYKKDGSGENSTANILGFSEITDMVTNIKNNIPEVLVKVSGAGEKAQYQKKTDEIFHLKVVRYTGNAANGNPEADDDDVLRVYLNNHEITRWVQSISTRKVEKVSYTLGSVTRIRPKRIVLPTPVSSGTIFGAYSSAWSKYALTTKLRDNTYDFSFYGTVQKPLFLELYATEDILTDQSTNYHYLSPRFLTELALDKRVSTKSYVMQTKPEVIGLNSYDIEYTTTAAINVDVLPISYLMHYFPSNLPTENKFMRKLFVYENALKYSTPINTGFRAKMLIANNSRHLVFLKKESDANVSVGVDLNLWTHNIISSSDEQIYEKVFKLSNKNEEIQVDSRWIQSEDTAKRIVDIIGATVDGFAKAVDLEIFGNPLIQVGDIVNLSYSLNGIENRRYLVQSVSLSYDGGISTNIKLLQLP